MKGHKEFDEWVRAARAEVSPSIDVTASVLSTVRARRAMMSAVPDRAPRLAAALAAAAAISILVPALEALLSLTNPMTTLIDTLRTVL